jgi:hypothetical protein
MNQFIGILVVGFYLISIYSAWVFGGKHKPNPIVKNIPKPCPKCNSPLSSMRSTSLKECTSCDYKEEWKLDEGQLPLVANNRMVKRNDKSNTS